ncbi:MAG: hypothetical protein ACRDHZ_18955, partial [Ktedonobacteraceae bacterium]
MQRITFPHISPIIERLLLSAPKNRRLDLAIATLLYRVRQEYALIVDEGTRSVEPIWYFADEELPHFLSTSKYISTCKPLALFPQRDPATCELVPSYSQEQEYYEEVVRWVGSRSMRRLHATFEQSGAYQMVTVQLLPFSQDDRQAIRQGKTLKNDWLQELYRLTCLVVLDAFTPDIALLLDSDRVPSNAFSSFLEHPRLARTQTMILLPHWLPCNALVFACMHEKYDSRTETWHRCGDFELNAETDERKEARYPEPCPGCGGYYCTKHFSKVAYWFDCRRGEQSDDRQISQRQKRCVCVTCAF